MVIHEKNRQIQLSPAHHAAAFVRLRRQAAPRHAGKKTGFGFHTRRQSGSKAPSGSGYPRIDIRH
jgi:hypothetical protein